MNYSASAIALCLAASGALAETKPYEDPAKEVLMRGVMPAAQSLAWTLESAQQANLLPGRMNVLVAFDPIQPQAVFFDFVCPDEFGAENCAQVTEFFRAIGGSCEEDTPFGTVCEGPEGPEVPLPD